MGKPENWLKVGEPRVLAEKFGKFLKEQDFNNPHIGEIETYALFGQKDWSVVLAVTDERQVLVEREFKQGRNGIEPELSAGTADFQGESPRTVMERELLQETGYQAKQVIELGYGWMATRNSPTMAHLFLALGCEKVQEAKMDPGEVIETELVPLDDWIQMIVRGQVNEWSAVMATVRALPYLDYEILDVAM